MTGFEFEIIVDGKRWSTAQQIAMTAGEAEAALHAHMAAVLRTGCRIECKETGRRWEQETPSPPRSPLGPDITGGGSFHSRTPILRN